MSSGRTASVKHFTVSYALNGWFRQLGQLRISGQMTSTYECSIAVENAQAETEIESGLSAECSRTFLGT